MSGFEGMNCAGVNPELFYPLETDRAGTQKAKDICAGCPAMQVCLDRAMEAEGAGTTQQYRHGIFGGLTPRQRYNLARGAVA